MATKSIAWNTGSGNINVEYGGNKDGTIVVTSDNNNLYESRSQQITVRTTDGSNIERTITIQQAAKVRIDISSATVSASNQTYSGSAKTPEPTVTLNGSTIPSSGYDVSYSNNTNAGTATITVTGKGDYTGTATGTFTILQKSLSITAKAQTITYGSSISQSISQVTTSGLVSGDSLTSITLTQSTSSVTSSGTITPSNAATSNGISNYSVSYYTGTLTITQATGYITFLFDSIGATYNPYDTTASLRVSTSSSGWEKTTAKTVSGYNVFRSISNKHKGYTSSVMKLTFVNNTGSAVTTTVKVGPATESSFDYVYIAQWNASDISPSSSTVPSSTIYSGSGKTAEWTDVSITIPTGTNTLQIVYRKDGSVSNEPDCGYFALPYNVSIASMVSSSVEYNTDASISYSSSNTSVVSVNSSTGAITINGVGTATITVSASSTTQYSSCSDTCTITVSAYKIAPTYTAPSTRSLTYSGSSQYLTTSGSTSHGTIYYSTDDSNWYTSRRTATTAGTYNCYWKLIGDSYHTDIDSTYLGTTSIAKASRTLSFADSYVVLNTSSNVTKTATPSTGSGDGAITYSISSTTYATINSSSGKVTSKTSDGSAVVTATIAEGTNYLSATTSYNLYVFATTHNYDYNGSYRSVTLPPGTYQFQCWGAQGGSNGTNSSYGITALAGGKGGYSVGQLTVSQATGVRVYVGGAGSSSSGGYNGGGSTTGTSQYNASNEFGYSKMGGGGGATDIRLSDGSLYSRMIVAGGGSGGAMGYKAVTTSTTTTVTDNSFTSASKETIADGNKRYYILQYSTGGYKNSTTYTVSGIPSGFVFNIEAWTTSGKMWGTYTGGWAKYNLTSTSSFTTPSNASSLYFSMYLISTAGDSAPDTVSMSLTVTHIETTSSTTTSTDGHEGYAGGGVRSIAYDTEWVGHQTAAGTNGAFGQGANQTVTNYRYCSGGGGGGWYGGGGGMYSDSAMYYSRCSGGGSGWVNTSASAGNRPSGFSSLQLDSGTTYQGVTSFPAPGGGNETGHAGNGYARITRIS